MVLLYQAAFMFTPPPMQIPVLNLRRDVSLVQVLCEEVKIFVGLLKKSQEQSISAFGSKTAPSPPMLFRHQKIYVQNM